MATPDSINNTNPVTESTQKDSWGEWRLFVLNKINENNNNTRLLADGFAKKYDRFEEKLSEIQDKIIEKLYKLEVETISNTDIKINELRGTIEEKIENISIKLENRIDNVETDLSDRIIDIENSYYDLNKKYNEEISRISQELAVLKTRFGIYIMIISSIAAFVVQFLGNIINFKVGK